jgi:large subunit ribosomal protein L23
MSLYRIILEPIVTEKASIADVKNNVIVVKVAPEATKIDIKNAFRTIYDIEVESVNVTAVREKFKNGRK